MINDKIVRRYIEQQGEQPDGKYLLKDDGEGEFIAKWEYQFAEPTTTQIAAIVDELNVEKQKEIKTEQIAATEDTGVISRKLEELIDNVENGTPLSQETKDWMNNRKAIRG